MAVTVTIRAAAANPDGSLTVRYDYDEGAGAFTNARAVLNPDALTDPAIRAHACFGTSLGVLFIYLAWWKARSANFSNTALVVGKTLTTDLTTANPIKVQ